MTVREWRSAVVDPSAQPGEAADSSGHSNTGIHQASPPHPDDHQCRTDRAATYGRPVLTKRRSLGAILGAMRPNKLPTPDELIWTGRRRPRQLADRPDNAERPDKYLWICEAAGVRAGAGRALCALASVLPGRRQLGHELIEAFVRGAVTHAHCLPPASGGLVVHPADRVVRGSDGRARRVPLT